METLNYFPPKQILSILFIKTIESTQLFLNLAIDFQMLSEMSVNDLASIGNTLGFQVGDTIDNPHSAKWC
jgi:hypothetical protein